MEKYKSFLVYIFLIIVIGLIVVFVVLPTNGDKYLSCVTVSQETGIKTYFEFTALYEDGTFKEIDNAIKFDISNDWNNKSVYVNSINKDSSYYTDMGFTYELVTDAKNKMLIAQMHGTNDTLNKELVYFLKMNKVQEHFESQNYVCEVGDKK